MPERYSEAARLLGRAIRQRRQRLAESQENIAHLADMHVTNYGKIERGQANPSLTTIVKIAHALNVDPGALLSGIPGDSVPGGSHRLTAADLIRERKNRESQ